MKVTINYEHGLNLVVKTAVSHAFDKRFTVFFMYGRATIVVPEFQYFLECMWAGFCECSRHSLGDQIRRVYDISVCLDDGSMYGVWVRYDTESNGLRYGSIC